MRLTPIPPALKRLAKKSGFKMTTSELMASYCVTVNEGSGVLVSAMSQEYSYVLTARHVVRESIADNVVTDHKGKELKVLGVLLHTDENHRKIYDCCVIQVEYVSSITQQAFPASLLPNRANLTLLGLPATERDSATPIKHYDGHMTSVVNELIVFTVDGIPGKDTISGMSGGGVYHVDGNRPYLVGVEFRMDGDDQDQQYGRVQCQGLNRFEEIIEVNSKASMVPAYLECFSRLRELIFGFNVVEQKNVVDLRAELLKFADGLVGQGMPAPYELMGNYKSDLLISSHRPGEVKDKELWVAYFEFLIICAIIDNVGTVDSAYVQGLERKRRVLYTSDGSNWVGKLELILKAARKLLDKNGTVIVVSPEQGADMLPDGFQVDRVVKNIALVPNAGPLAPIDQAESSIYKSFVLAHLEGLRKQCVVRKETDFAKAEAGVAQLHVFRKHFNAFIK
jgi:hypothetical protein